MRLPLWGIFQFGFGLRVEGGARIPSHGPVLLLANHQSYFDPPLVGLATTRQLSYLGRSTLFSSRFFSWLIRSLGCVPIDVESGGRDGLQAVLNLLKENRAVLIFPEGERTTDGTVQPLKPGIRLLIRHSQATIVPVGISGGFEAYSRYHKVPSLAPLFMPVSKRRIAVSVGRPLDRDALVSMKKNEQLDFVREQLREVKERADALRGIAIIKSEIRKRNPK